MCWEFLELILVLGPKKIQPILEGNSFSLKANSNSNSNSMEFQQFGLFIVDIRRDKNNEIKMKTPHAAHRNNLSF